MSRLLTRETFDFYLSDHSRRKRNAWNNRWGYHKAVVNMLKDVQFDRVLELGCNAVSIVNDSDCMYIGGMFPQKRHIENKYEHNAIDTPWPMADKQYDLFIALQVWEHLGGRQSGNHQKAFAEVMRVSKMAILSFPYKWIARRAKDKNKGHADINNEIISQWTLNAEPFKQLVVRPSNHRRKILFFKF